MLLYSQKIFLFTKFSSINVLPQLDCAAVSLRTPPPRCPAGDPMTPWPLLDHPKASPLLRARPARSSLCTAPFLPASALLPSRSFGCLGLSVTITHPDPRGARATDGASLPSPHGAAPLGPRVLHTPCLAWGQPKARASKPHLPEEPHASVGRHQQAMDVSRTPSWCRAGVRVCARACVLSVLPGRPHQRRAVCREAPVSQGQGLEAHTPARPPHPVPEPCCCGKRAQRNGGPWTCGQTRRHRLNLAALRPGTVVAERREHRARLGA